MGEFYSCFGPKGVLSLIGRLPLQLALNESRGPRCKAHNDVTTNERERNDGS